MMKKIIFLLATLIALTSNAQTTILPGKSGGTGIANVNKTITLGGSVITTGTSTPTLAFPSTNKSFTFPDTSGRLAMFHYTLPRSGTLSGYPLTGTIEFAPSSITTALGSTTSDFAIGAGDNIDLDGAASQYALASFGYSSNTVLLGGKNSGGTKTYFTVAPNGATFTYHDAKYAADYSSTFTSRSLIDSGFASSHYAPISYTASATSATAPLLLSSNIMSLRYNTGLTVISNSLQTSPTQTHVTSVGTLTTGTWNSDIISPTYGGTGINNGLKTITLSENFATAGGNRITLTGTGLTDVTLPTSGTLYGTASTSFSSANLRTSLSDEIGGGAALFDGATPTSFVLTNATGLPLSSGVTGQLPLANGGTNANLTASNGGIFYSTSTAGAILSGTATANKVLMSGSSAAPVWSTPTYPNAAPTSGTFIRGDGTNYVASTLVLPNSATTNRIAYATGTNTLGESANLAFNGTRLNIGASSAATQGALLHIAQNSTVTASSAYTGAIVGNINNTVDVALELKNVNTGTASAAVYYATSDAGAAVFGAFSSGHTAVPNVQSAFGVYNINMSGGMAIGNRNASTFNIITNDAIRANINSSGRLFVGGSTSATALLHLGAGTASASTAPLKFTSGTNLTTAEAGAWEFDGTNFYASPSTTRKRMPLTNNATPTNGQIPIGNGTDYTVANITSSGGSITITNGSGTIDLSTTQALASGTYTPTLTGVTNITASTAYTTGYYRIGSTVTVFGKIDINATLAASAATEIAISLPIASNLAAEQDLGGVASSDALASQVARIKGDGTNDRASVVFKSISVTNDSYSFEFSYQIK